MGNNVIFRYWVKHSMRDFHVVLGVVAVVLQILGRISKHPELFPVSDAVALFAILHFFIHGYFHRQQQFLTDNQRVYTLPKKKITRMGAGFLTGFLIAVSVGMAVVKEIYTGTLLAKLKAMFLYIMGGLFKALLGTDGLGKDKLLLKDNTNLLGVMNQVSPKTDSPWDKVLNYVQTALIVIGVVLLVVLCITVIINYIRRVIGGVRMEAKYAEGRDVHDREERLRETGTKREKLLDFSPNAKTRRIYRRSINKQRRRGQAVPEWMTPAEIENMVSMPGDVQHQELHHIYEKARYSESGCTEEDAKRAKMLKL